MGLNFNHLLKQAAHGHFAPVFLGSERRFAVSALGENINLLCVQEVARKMGSILTAVDELAARDFSAETAFAFSTRSACYHFLIKAPSREQAECVARDILELVVSADVQASPGRAAEDDTEL